MLSLSLILVYISFQSLADFYFIDCEVHNAWFKLGVNLVYCGTQRVL